MHDLRQWQKSGLKKSMLRLMFLVANLSTPAAWDSTKLQECFSRHHVNPRNVHIEITESMLMGDASHCLSTLESIAI